MNDNDKMSFTARQYEAGQRIVDELRPHYERDVALIAARKAEVAMWERCERIAATKGGRYWTTGLD